MVSKMIGKGSFAKVYLATKKEDGKDYAVKAFNKEFMMEQFRVHNLILMYRVKRVSKMKLK